MTLAVPNFIGCPTPSGAATFCTNWMWASPHFFQVGSPSCHRWTKKFVGYPTAPLLNRTPDTSPWAHLWAILHCPQWSWKLSFEAIILARNHVCTRTHSTCPYAPPFTWGETDAGARHNSYFTFCLLILMFFVANLYIRYLPSSYPQYPSHFSTVLRIIYVFLSQWICRPAWKEG
jgi:hypothetical protein